MKTRLRHMVESGKNRANEWKGGIQEGIRERPIQSVLIAAVAGAVIGVLLGRRAR
ncbi:MAG: glycine zipper domain-containing protein [Planctomycetota bacterium]